MKVVITWLVGVNFNFVMSVEVFMVIAIVKEEDDNIIYDVINTFSKLI